MMWQSASTTWWESKLARRLDFVAVIAAMVIVVRVALEEDLSWLTWVLAGAAAVLVTVTRWPYGALFVVMGMSAMPRFFVEVFGWKARPEHFAAVIVSVAICVWLLRNKRRMRLEKVDYWVLAYVAVNYISSAFSSAVPSATLRWALMNNLAVLPYFLVRLLVRDLETLRKAFRILLAVGLAESVYGILCYALHLTFGTNFGMGIGQYLVDVAAPYGSLYEPNLFGAYTAFYAVLFLALYVFEEKHRFGSLICFVIASLATALSLSRAALVALVVAIAWVFWYARHRKTGDRNNLAFLLPVSALILITSVSFIGGVLQKRFTSLVDLGLEEETAVTRYVVIVEAMRDIPNHLLLGNGTASLQLSFEWGNYIPEWESERAWVANVIVRIFHDTGLLGLAVFLAFIVSLLSKSRRSLRGWNTRFPLLIGLSAGILLYGISFQFTDGTTLAFCWVQLGLFVSASNLMNGSRDTSNGNDHVAHREG